MKANKPNSKEINLHPSKKRKSKSIIKAPKKKLSDDWIMQYTDSYARREGYFRGVDREIMQGLSTMGAIWRHT